MSQKKIDYKTLVAGTDYFGALGYAPGEIAGLAYSNITNAVNEFKKFALPKGGKRNQARQYVMLELIEETRRQPISTALSFLVVSGQFHNYQQEWVRQHPREKDYYDDWIKQQKTKTESAIDYSQFVKTTNYFAVLGISPAAVAHLKVDDIIKIADDFERYNGVRQYEPPIISPDHLNPFRQSTLFVPEWKLVEEAILHMKDPSRFKRYKAEWQEQNKPVFVFAPTVRQKIENYIASQKTILVEGELRVNKNPIILMDGGFKTAGEDLTGVNLRGVVLSGMDFRGSILDGAKLRQANIAGAFFDNKTRVNQTTNMVRVKGAENAMGLGDVPGIKTVIGGEYLFPKVAKTKETIRVAAASVAANATVPPSPSLPSRAPKKFSYKRDPDKKKKRVAALPVTKAAEIPAAERAEKFDNKESADVQAAPQPETLPAAVPVFSPPPRTRAEQDRQDALERQQWAELDRRNKTSNADQMPGSVIPIPEISEADWRDILGPAVPKVLPPGGRPGKRRSSRLSFMPNPSLS